MPYGRVQTLDTEMGETEGGGFDCVPRTQKGEENMLHQLLALGPSSANASGGR